MAEYIERGALMGVVDEITWYHINDQCNLQSGASDEGCDLYKVGDIIKALEDAPAIDAVRVIRCENCMHSKEAADEKMRGLFVWCDVCKRYKIANGFCDDGKKRVKIRKLEVYKK